MIIELCVVAYILSLSFQVAGAVLLILKYMGNTRQRIIEEYFPGSNIVERDEKENCRLETEKVQMCVRKIYDNRLSFSFIAVGYMLSIFGDIKAVHRVYILLGVVIFTTILIILEKIGVYILAKCFYKKDIIVKYDDIQDRADTEVTEQEILDLFKEE